MEQTFPNDVLTLFALDSDLKSIINLCKTSKKVNDSICNNPYFWKQKLQREYYDIDISNVTEYKNLYIYLKKRPRVNNESQQWGDVRDNKGRISVLGNGGQQYIILENGKFNSWELSKSAIYFPEYSPEYFHDIGTDIFILSRLSVIEMAKNFVNNTSFVTGPYSEKYIIIIESTLKKDSLNAIINEWKRPFTTDNQPTYFLKGGKFKTIIE